MKKFKVFCSGLTLIFLLILTSCSKDGTMGEPDPSALTFKEVMAKGGNMGDPTESTTVDTNKVQKNLPLGSGTYNCSSITYKVDAASGGDSGFPLFSPGADVIYPGSMLQGNSLNQSPPNPIVVARAGGTISWDIIDGNLKSSFQVSEVKRSTITDAMNNILANSTGSLPSNFNINIHNIQSREQFALALGVDIKSSFVDIESKLNYKTDTKKSSYLVSINQQYYNMIFDLPTSLDQWFAPSVTPDQLARYVGEGNPATYISEITYGRIFYMLIQSTSSQTEMDLAVKGAFKGGTVRVDADLEVSKLSTLDELEINLFAYGGEAGPVFDAIGETNLNKLKEHLKASSTMTSGRPLSYKVRNVLDNQIVATQLATQYDVVECKQISNVGTLPAIAHWTNHPVLEELGPVVAAYADSNDKFILLNSIGKWARSTINAQGEGILEGPFDWSNPIPFTSIGAACRLRGPGTSLYVFNDLGNKYSVYSNDGKWGPVNDISEFFGGEMPFVTAGMGAIAYQSGSSDLAHLVFDKLGTSHARGYWNKSVANLFQHYPNMATSGLNFIGNMINGVGAALGFDNGNAGVSIFFNLDGTEYIVHGDFGTGYETRGPFSL